MFSQEQWTLIRRFIQLVILQDGEWCPCVSLKLVCRLSWDCEKDYCASSGNENCFDAKRMPKAASWQVSFLVKILKLPWLHFFCVWLFVLPGKSIRVQVCQVVVSRSKGALRLIRVVFLLFMLTPWLPSKGQSAPFTEEWGDCGCCRNKNSHPVTKNTSGFFGHQRESGICWQQLFEAFSWCPSAHMSRKRSSVCRVPL